MSTLSESDSTSTSSSSIDGNPFHNLGEFNLERGKGPARSLPDALKALRLGLTWTVDFEEVDDPAAKNHITSRVTFAEPYVDGMRTVYGAKISMELARPSFRVVDNDEPGAYFNHFIGTDDYHSGVFTVKLLDYEVPSRRTVQSRTFNFIGSQTLGDLIDLIIDERMDEFVFLLYDGAWEGCGDFVIQMWALLIRRGKLDNPDDHATLLSRDLCVTYRTNKDPVSHVRAVTCPVGKGCWVRWERFTTDEDGLVPPSIYGTQKEDA